MPAKRKKQRRAAKTVSIDPGESRAAIWVTTGWINAMLTTLAAETVSVAAFVLSRRNPETTLLGFLAPLLLFAALISGLASLALCVAAYRLRRVRPPRILAATTVAIAVVPVALAALAVLARD